MLRTLALTGPTASGKTALSIELAKRLGCEIISLDSMQIYRGMDIGTAKATEAERAEVPHHLIDFLSPLQDYSAEAYRADALRVAGEITERGKIPLFVGGTGLYLDTLLRVPSGEVPPSDPEWRERMLSGIKSEADIDALYERLREIDEDSAAATHKNNIKRVLRAIEIYEKTGKPKSYFDRISKKTSPDISALAITLDFHSRDLLYDRIGLRVDEMVKMGLLDEARSLYEAGLLKEGTTAGQAIGYKELVSYLKGEASLGEALESIKLSTRRYAKRQLTWFRHTDAHRVFVDDEEGKPRDKGEILAEILSYAKDIEI